MAARSNPSTAIFSLPLFISLGIMGSAVCDCLWGNWGNWGGVGGVGGVEGVEGVGTKKLLPCFRGGGRRPEGSMANGYKRVWGNWED